MSEQQQQKKIQDLFIVYRDEQLINEWVEVLVSLYQPFIGGKSVSLYLTLHTLYQQPKAQTHHELLKYTQFDIDDLMTAFKYLEATSLIKSYRATIDDVPIIVYTLISPLTKKTFFLEPSFCALLKSWTDDIYFNQIKKTIEQQQLLFAKIENSLDISAKLTDVFSKEILLLNTQNGMEHLSEKLDVEQNLLSTFHFEPFYLALPVSLREQIEFNSEHRQVLAKIAKLYQLDAQMMAIVFLNAYQKTHGALHEKDLREAAVHYCGEVLRTRTKSGEPNSVIHESNESTVQQSQQVTGKINERLIQIAKSKQVLDYFELLTGKRPTTNDLKIIETLHLDYKLPDDAINILLDYVYRKNKHFPKAYIEAIANQWHQQNVRSAEEAFIALNDFVKRSKQKGQLRQGMPNTRTKRTEKISQFGGEKAQIKPEDNEKLLQALAELEE